MLTLAEIERITAELAEARGLLAKCVEDQKGNAILMDDYQEWGDCWAEADAFLSRTGEAR